MCVYVRKTRWSAEERCIHALLNLRRIWTQFTHTKQSTIKKEFVYAVLNRIGGAVLVVSRIGRSHVTGSMNHVK